MQQFGGNFGALAAVTTGINTVIKQLAAMTTTHYNKISARIFELKLHLPTTTTPTLRGTHYPLASDRRGNLNRRIEHLQASIKEKWVVGGFCSTHGHGVCEGHDIMHFNVEGKRHIKLPLATTPRNQEGTKTRYGMLYFCDMGGRLVMITQVFQLLKTLIFY